MSTSSAALAPPQTDIVLRYAKAYHAAEKALKAHEANGPSLNQSSSSVANAGNGLNNLSQAVHDLQETYRLTFHKSVRQLTGHNAEMLKQLALIKNMADACMTAIKSNPRHLPDEQADWLADGLHLSKVFDKAEERLSQLVTTEWNGLVCQQTGEKGQTVPTRVLKYLPVKEVDISEIRRLRVDDEGSRPTFVQIRWYSETGDGKRTFGKAEMVASAVAQFSVQNFRRKSAEVHGTVFVDLRKGFNVLQIQIPESKMIQGSA